MRIALWLLLLGLGPAGLAQGPVLKQKPTLQVTLLMPTQLGDPVFDRVTAPLGVVDGSVQIPLIGGFGVGAGASMMFWELQERAFTQFLLKGEARRSLLYGKVQYATYTGAKTFFEWSLRMGRSSWIWDRNACAGKYTQAGFHWGTSMGYYLHASKNLAFGVTVGYEQDATAFAPAVICEPFFPGYTDSGDRYRFFTLGLGFSTRFEKAEEERW
jgi:hypothetical protein